ncbi:hypothetical protein IJ732_05475, partial [bacterium]|nr:hypothetical protein [bacterium]
MRGACNATKQSLTSLDEIATPTSRLVMTNSTRHYEEQSDEVADFRTDGVEDEVRANPDSEQKERTCGEATKSDSLRAWRKSKTIPNALNTRHSETPKAGSESVTRASNKQTLMSTDDRLTRFGQPQRFALSQVQGDGWSSNYTLD